MQTFDYDFFVIGAGSGGVRAARTAAALGARTAIAEERFFGGTCVNVGCIPKKLYNYAAAFSDAFRDAEAYGWQVHTASFDWSILKINKDKEIKRLNGIYENLLKNSGVTVLSGRAEVTGPNQVKIGEQQVSAKHILIATGGKTSLPNDIPGVELGLDSDDFFELTEQPRRVVVVGGGYIATELAAVFAGVGTQVELVHRGKTLLRGFDDDIAAFVTEAVSRYTNLRLETSITAIKENGDKALTIELSDGQHLETDQILFATGRSPNSRGLGLEALGVKLNDKGAIAVDKNFETNVPGLYAVGDVIDRVALTPVALAEGQTLARRLFANEKSLQKSSVSYDLIPSAVFCDPQVAVVGQTEAEARKDGKAVQVFKSRFRPLKHTMTGADEFTLMKLIVDKETDRVLGLHMAGADAAEIVQGFAVAMQAGATKADFDNTLGIHPTAAEEFVTMRTPVA